MTKAHIYEDEIFTSGMMTVSDLPFEFTANISSLKSQSGQNMDTLKFILIRLLFYNHHHHQDHQAL